MRDERGSVAPLIVGFAMILLVAVAVVVDASAAFVQRQGLNTLADGAALYGADLGASGVYVDGLPEDRLRQIEPDVRRAVRQYLAVAEAEQRFPGIDVGVQVDAVGGRVTVTLSAPLDLPLTVPGTPDRPVVAASGTAAVTVEG